MLHQPNSVYKPSLAMTQRNQPRKKVTGEERTEGEETWPDTKDTKRLRAGDSGPNGVHGFGGSSDEGKLLVTRNLLKPALEFSCATR